MNKSFETVAESIHKMYNFCKNNKRYELQLLPKEPIGSLSFNHTIQNGYLFQIYTWHILILTRSTSLLESLFNKNRFPFILPLYVYKFASTTDYEIRLELVNDIDTRKNLIFSLH